MLINREIVMLCKVILLLHFTFTLYMNSIKGIVHPKIKFLLLITHPNVDPNR